MAANPDYLEVKCESCGATLRIEPLMRTSRCPYCDSPAVVDRPATEDRPDPAFVIPFSVDRVAAAGAIRSWLGTKRMAPTALRRARPEQVTGVYLPGYLYSATADSMYSAVVGEAYTASRVDPRSKKVRQVRRIEYHDVRGEHACHLKDVVVTASTGIPNDEIEAVEPFDLEAALRYSPAAVAGWVSEEPSLTTDECAALARDEARALIDRRLRRFLPGDTLRSLKHHIRFQAESLDLVLLPLWVFAIRHRPDREPIRLLVNGQTGTVAGEAPVSWVKVAAIAALVLATIGAGVLLGWLL
jgi:hypothetical protein